jgi:hypothetical protein
VHNVYFFFKTTESPIIEFVSSLMKHSRRRVKHIRCDCDSDDLAESDIFILAQCAGISPADARHSLCHADCSKYSKLQNAMQTEVQNLTFDCLFLKDEVYKLINSIRYIFLQ